MADEASQTSNQEAQGARQEPAAPRHPPRRRLSADGKNALLTAGLTLLVIAGAAFLAGLL